MQTAITGAAGAVGRVVAEAFDETERILLTHSEHEDVDGELLDATDRDAFDAAVAGADALVHLAWDPADRDAWDGGDETNVRMAANAFDAALEAGVDRVVMASSVHAFGLYDRDDPAEFEALVERPTTTVRPDTPPRPDSYYGVAKVAVEGLCRFYADRHGLDVVAVRIGWLMDETELRETADGADARHRFARATWLSPRDCRALFRAAVEHPLDGSPVVAHGVSRNSDRHLSLTETMQRLGYRPSDDAAAVLDG
ncbi:NAD(P)-dependent oxidoreductase [Halorubrum sp. AD140]|uniref:NAD-dependent epimerase/dehydratase family protein n=1 Tax=Halorubrum sp. AD140 TaxID=3050073 RepID=UPI002ACD1CD7|nr:NAD(P)-dependent oxidoreductase [Halorubrum sp. AD140]MDZ5812726.1 NAD(P)-dependent oxidoreductase [Halorubrum sp. AD140]